MTACSSAITRMANHIKIDGENWSVPMLNTLRQCYSDVTCKINNKEDSDCFGKIRCGVNNITIKTRNFILSKERINYKCQIPMPEDEDENEKLLVPLIVVSILLIIIGLANIYFIRFYCKNRRSRKTLLTNEESNSIGGIELEEMPSISRIQLPEIQQQTRLAIENENFRRDPIRRQEVPEIENDVRPAIEYVRNNQIEILPTGAIIVRQ